MATVACKLPNGLTVDHQGLSLTLRGANDAGAVGVAGHRYGLTELSDKTGENESGVEWFMDWLTGPGKSLPAVERGLIFVQTNDRNADAQAREQGGQLLTGAEGLDPDKPGEGLEPTDEQKRENAKAAKS